jgi:hypothetical protein
VVVFCQEEFSSALVLVRTDSLVPDLFVLYSRLLSSHGLLRFYSINKSGTRLGVVPGTEKKKAPRAKDTELSLLKECHCSGCSSKAEHVNRVEWSDIQLLMERCLCSLRPFHPLR